MKKFNLDPMSLDKETIAMLDDKQLKEIVGGLALNPCTGSGLSCFGTSTPAVSTGCGAGGSTCVNVN